MKTMHCDDLMKGCGFVASGATEDEVLQKAAAHAKNEHGIQSISSEMAQKIRSVIRDEQTA